MCPDAALEGPLFHDCVGASCESYAVAWRHVIASRVATTEVIAGSRYMARSVLWLPGARGRSLCRAIWLVHHVELPNSGSAARFF